MLKSQYENVEEIPEAQRELFTERNGVFEIEVEGMKTAGDVERLQTALSNERTAHKDTKGRYNWVGELTSEDVQKMKDAQEDLQHQLELKPEGLTDEQVEERAEKLAARKTRALERSIEDLTVERDSFGSAIKIHEAAQAQRLIRDSVDEALSGPNALSVVESAREDIIPFAERVMAVVEGKVVSRDEVGVEPGISFADVLADLKASGRRSHWFPGNTGAGANGSQEGGTSLGSNPFASDNFNLTEIGKIVSADPVKAKTLAKAAGVNPAKFGL